MPFKIHDKSQVLKHVLFCLPYLLPLFVPSQYDMGDPDLYDRGCSIAAARWVGYYTFSLAAAICLSQNLLERLGKALACALLVSLGTATSFQVLILSIFSVGMISAGRIPCFNGRLRILSIVFHRFFRSLFIVWVSRYVPDLLNMEPEDNGYLGGFGLVLFTYGVILVVMAYDLLWHFLLGERDNASSKPSQSAESIISLIQS